MSGGLDVIRGVRGDVDPFRGDAPLMCGETGIDEGAIAVLFEQSAAADREAGQRKYGIVGGPQLQTGRLPRVEEVRAEGDGKAAPCRGDRGAARQLTAADGADHDRVQPAGDVAET